MSSHQLVTKVVAFALGLTALSCKPSGPALSVLITLSPEVRARCVQLAAISSDGERRTEPMLREERTELVVAVLQEKHPPAVTLEARGYLNDDCSGLNEVSEQLAATFPKSGATTVTVELKGISAAADADGDGFRPAAQGGPDCDDANLEIHPGATELCADGVDNDCQGGKDCEDVACEAQACGAAGSSCASGGCAETTCDDAADNDADGKRDCLDSDCAQRACGMGGTCDANQQCTGATAELCRDLVDNDADGLIDCADTADCQNQVCEDGNFCTQGETCGGGGACGGGSAITCNSPPSVCFAPAGTCSATTGQCVYSPRDTGTPCNDANLCTLLDTCNGAGACVPGAPKSCNVPGRCETGPGTCAPMTGDCTYPAAAELTACDDGAACTSSDKCDANRGCTGTAYACPPPTINACFTQFCKGDGTCGQTSVPAGTACGTGVCMADGTCAKGFPYAPANFTTAGMIPSNAITVDCALTIDSSGAADVPTTWCGRPGPRGVIVSQGAGSSEIYVFPISNLTVTAAGTMRLRGSRPIVFAVFGDATIDGVIDAGAAQAVNGAGGVFSCSLLVNATTPAGLGSGAGGGAGGGFGGKGAKGGRSGDGPRNPGGVEGDEQGVATLVPLRGGCSGGAGGYPGGAGVSGLGGGAGGAVQLSVAGTLTVTGRISAPGGGGRGGTNAGGGGGGGGSGGAILLEAATLDLKSAALVTAQGGGGGQGSGGALLQGAFGAEGHTSDLNPAPGGEAPLNSTGGPGGAGGVEDNDPQDGEDADGAGNGGGGGGGGIGRIAIRPHGTCTLPTIIGPDPVITGGSCD